MTAASTARRAPVAGPSARRAPASSRLPLRVRLVAVVLVLLLAALILTGLDHGLS